MKKTFTENLNEMRQSLIDKDVDSYHTVKKLAEEIENEKAKISSENKDRYVALPFCDRIYMRSPFSTEPSIGLFWAIGDPGVVMSSPVPTGEKSRPARRIFGERDGEIDPRTGRKGINPFTFPQEEDAVVFAKRLNLSKGSLQLEEGRVSVTPLHK